MFINCCCVTEQARDSGDSGGDNPCKADNAIHSQHLLSFSELDVRIKYSASVFARLGKI